MSKTFKELLAEAKLPERTVWVCLRGDLTVEAQRIEDELEQVQKDPTPRRLADASPEEEKALELEAVRKRMREESVPFRLRAHPADGWRSLKAKHPVGKEPSATDQVLGASATPFFNEAVRAAIVEPSLDDEDWEQLLAVLSDGQWSELVEAVYALNEQPVSVPFSSRAWAVLRAQSGDSESPETPE